MQGLSQVVLLGHTTWLDFCHNIGSTSETAKLNKILAKNHSSPSFFNKSESSKAEFSRGTLEVLVHTHFLASEKGWGVKTLLGEYAVPVGKLVITENKIGWVLNNFSANSLQHNSSHALEAAKKGAAVVCSDFRRY